MGDITEASSYSQRRSVTTAAFGIKYQKPLLFLSQTVASKMSRYASIISTRPFRSPHHTISDVALVGGGTHPQPGEISLAHNGVLFLDELPEFKRQVLEVMRQPLEERRVTISRSKYSVEFPASFMFIAAMNPCPCGNYNHPTIACTCKPFEV